MGRSVWPLTQARAGTVTPEIMAWGEKAIAEYDVKTDGDTLELGSHDINGSFRKFFTGPYWGIDQLPAPGVDEVMNAHDLPRAWAGRFDTVVCTEMIEHDPMPWQSISEAASVLKKGGKLLLSTCGFGFPRHDAPTDCFRYTTDGLRGLLEWAGLETECTWVLSGPYSTVTAVGRR